MTVRLIERAKSSIPACWQRGHVTPTVPAPRTPEPAQLYALVVLTLYLHGPTADGCCSSCKAMWPCEPVRLACRLREGF